MQHAVVLIQSGGGTGRAKPGRPLRPEGEGGQRAPEWPEVAGVVLP